jgi:hypothetical protein
VPHEKTPPQRGVLESGLRACGAGVDDVDVVDRAAAGVARRAGDAAARALGVDVEAAHLGGVVEVDVVGVVVGDRGSIGRVRAVQRVGADGQGGGLADQLLAGLEVDSGGVAAAGAVSVGSGVAGAPSLGSLTTSVVFPTALSAPSNVSSSATGASSTAVTVASRLPVLLRLSGLGPSSTWNVTLRVSALGVSLVLLYLTARSAVW